MIYLELLLGFLKVGFFSFGGAYSAIPLIREVVSNYGWLTDDELSYMIAVSESTPGPLMVNLATYVGSTKGGVLGALLATATVVLPSFLIIIIVVKLLNRLMKNSVFAGVIDGLQSCIIGIILATGLTMTANNLPLSQPELRTVILTLLLASIMFVPKFFKKKVSPILLIAIGAALGVIFYI